jgi:hypothetical protein
MTQIVDLNKLSKEELIAHVAKMEKAEHEEKIRKQKQYEEMREQSVVGMCNVAIRHSEELAMFKHMAFDTMNQFYTMMIKYGNVQNDAKGNFTIYSNDKRFKVLFCKNVAKGFDERGNLAESKLKEFLESFVKKRDLASYDIIICLLERNKVSGDFDAGLIGRLFQLEDKFDHPLWKEAISLFKESYTERSSTEYIRFYKMNETGGYDIIPLSFSNINPKAPAAK